MTLKDPSKGDPIHGPLFPKNCPPALTREHRERNALEFCKGKHPLYEIQVRAELLERETPATSLRSGRRHSPALAVA